MLKGCGVLLLKIIKPAENKLVFECHSHRFKRFAIQERLESLKSRRQSFAENRKKTAYRVNLISLPLLFGTAVTWTQLDQVGIIPVLHASTVKKSSIMPTLYTEIK